MAFCKSSNKTADVGTFAEERICPWTIVKEPQKPFCFACEEMGARKEKSH